MYSNNYYFIDFLQVRIMLKLVQNPSLSAKNEARRCRFIDIFLFFSATHANLFVGCSNEKQMWLIYLHIVGIEA